MHPPGFRRDDKPYHLWYFHLQRKVLKTNPKALKLKKWFIWLLIFCSLPINVPLSYSETSSKQIQIPSGLATVISQFKGDGPLVIHIQDAHGIYEAQIQIRKILDYLRQNYPIGVIGLEGGSGKLHPEYFRILDDRKLNSKLIDSLVKEGEISGAEFSAIETEGKGSTDFIGIEDKEIYRKNLELYRSVFPETRKHQQYFSGERNKLAVLKTRFYSKELLRFDAQRNRFQNASINPASYLQTLGKLGAIQPRLDSKSDSYDLLTEIRRTEKLIYEKLLRRPEERQIFKLSEKFNTLEKISRLEASREQYNAFKSKRWKFPNSDQAGKFYELAAKRDAIFVDQILKISRDKNSRISILVTGGFHTPGIEKNLKERKIPFITLAPNFRTENPGSSYHKVILGEKTWLDHQWNRFHDKIPPPLATQDARIYAEINRRDPDRQRKLIAGALIRNMKLSVEKFSAGGLMTARFRNSRLVIFPSGDLVKSHPFIVSQDFNENMKTKGRPRVYRGRASLHSQSFAASLGGPEGGTPSERLRIAKISDTEIVGLVSSKIKDCFNDYFRQFEAVTQRAKHLFENRLWPQVLEDAKERIEMYRLTLDLIEKEIRLIMGERVKEHELWFRIKYAYFASISEQYDSDLGLTFFYSVMRRMYLDNGYSVEYTDDGIMEDIEQKWKSKIEKPYRIYKKNSSATEELMKSFLIDAGFTPPENKPEAQVFENLERDAKLSGNRIEMKLQELTGSAEYDSIEILKPVFFRNKGAYIAGRIRQGGKIIPLVIALLNSENGIQVDAVLLDEQNVSNIFSYTRSNFHVDYGAYREIADFLESIMPKKGRAAIYSSIGFIHPGKIELIKQLRKHLRKSGEKFEATKGIKGWVMVAFTTPSFPYVLKIISDKSEKEGFGKDNVRRNYNLVHTRDRAGKMLDVVTYKNLRFEKDLFTPEVLEELTQRAPSEFQEIENDGEKHIVLKSVYVQRKVTPLDVYLEQHKNNPQEIRRALNEWGLCIKGLAAAGIWVGDFKTKNYGVTAMGRVVSFDYDELDGLMHLNFVRNPPPYIPPAEDEPWWMDSDWRDRHLHHRIYLSREFGQLDLSREQSAVFEELHGDLLEVDYWQKVQQDLSEGKLPDVYPYALTEKLHKGGSTAARIEAQSLGLAAQLGYFEREHRESVFTVKSA